MQMLDICWISLDNNHSQYFHVLPRSYPRDTCVVSPRELPGLFVYNLSTPICAFRERAAFLMAAGYIPFSGQQGRQNWSTHGRDFGCTDISDMHWSGFWIGDVCWLVIISHPSLFRRVVFFLQVKDMIFRVVRLLDQWDSLGAILNQCCVTFSGFVQLSGKTSPQRFASGSG